MIVGAPLDKVTALEPHMDQLLAITKNTTTHYSFVTRISDAGHEMADRQPAIPNTRGPINGAAESAVSVAPDSHVPG